MAEQLPFSKEEQEEKPFNFYLKGLAEEDKKNNREMRKLT